MRLVLLASFCALSSWIASFAQFAAADEPPAAQVEFLAQVREHYDAWDTDDDGLLSRNEIELAVADPRVKGKSAAAAATLRRSIKSNRDLLTLSLDQITARVEKKAKEPELPDMVDLYAACVERIATTRRDLFTTDLPDSTKLSQGRLGDCFLLASLGTIAANDPQLLKNMFRLLPDDKYEVTFGTGRKLVLDMPTDAEICIASRNQDNGLWAVCYEKAVGTVYLERQETKKHVTPLSIIGVGGTPNVPLELATGNAVKRSGCEDFQGPDGLKGEERERRLDEMRAKLIDNMRSGRLIVGGTAPKGRGQTLVPGLYYNHSYGVLGYDEKTDEVTFWNPFGNVYKPKGEPGLEHGFVTSHGRFTMPLEQAVMWFGSFSLETAERTTRFDPMPTAGQ